MDSCETDHLLRSISTLAVDRFEFWKNFLNSVDAETAAEIGVYQGAFASKLLAGCPKLSRYYMIDPWKHLSNWNKPLNKDDRFLNEAMKKAVEATDFAQNRRKILRGTTIEVIDEIPDKSLDFAYIDGDHTLRGILIDLIRVAPKMRRGGWLAGDDLISNIWHHGPNFEPTLVFPIAVHFAEAMGMEIWGLPHNQFLINCSSDGNFKFRDLTQTYLSTSLRDLRSHRLAEPG